MELKKKATTNSGGSGGSSSSSGRGGVGGGSSSRNSSISSDLESKMFWEKVRHIFKHYLKRKAVWGLII